MEARAFIVLFEVPMLQSIPIERERSNSAVPQIVRPRQLKAAIGLSRQTVYRLIAAGKFPAPIRLSPGCTGWLLSDIAAWLASRETGTKARKVAFTSGA